ncbi:cytochrome c551 [Ureibacillus chungkukjangi]|uniref:Cytochrome c551 n=1 Tax=Ureibacillus chungkukjangi TaxID=1202712 RepID=A0A318TNC6_9BACL|nr:c-type cytochrome [Ureibacillus chungkukjangi]PYF05983.1 cytochrome c551 [Ureibacillus chungkukjangi]
MKKAWLALVFGSALFLAACGGGDDEATDTNTGTEDTVTEETGDTATGGADAAAGEELVQSSCTSCHGGNLQGMGNTPALSDVGSRLSEEEIHDVIVNGRGGMPKGLLQGEDAEAAAAWLAQQQ